MTPTTIGPRILGIVPRFTVADVVMADIIEDQRCGPLEGVRWSCVTSMASSSPLAKKRPSGQA
jgi:hypothetical protein